MSSNTDVPPESSSSPVSKRACDRCHAQKLKCSGLLPCSRCDKHGRPCTYRNVRLRKGPAPRRRFAKTERPPSRKASPVHNPEANALDPFSLLFDTPAFDNAFASLANAPDPGSTLSWPDEGPTGVTDGTLTADNELTNFLGFSSFSSPSIPIGNRDATIPFETRSPLSTFRLPDDEPEEAAAGSSSMAIEPSLPFVVDSGSWSFNSMSTGQLPLSLPLESSSFHLMILAETLFRPQISMYFDRINPMMPVLDSQAILSHLDDSQWLTARDNQALVLVMTGLSLVHPFSAEDRARKADREKQALMLLDQACRLIASWDYGCFGTVERTMTSFLMFGILHEVGQTWGARMRLREAVTMGESMGLDRKEAYSGLSEFEARRRLRLFYILALTERAYALQRSPGGNLSFDGRISGFAQAVLTMHPNGDSDDPVTLSLQHLSYLFSHIDKDLIRCWNRTCDLSACAVFTHELATSLLVKLSGSAESIFNPQGGLHSLNEAQCADLLVTWQWIKSRLWLLASLHGLTSEVDRYELSSKYVIDLGRQTVEICNGLSFGAMECHGRGFVEKIFDIAELVTTTLGALPVSTPGSVSETLFFMVGHDAVESGFDAAQTLQLYVARHHRGKVDLAPRLQTIISDARVAQMLATIV